MFDVYLLFSTMLFLQPDVTDLISIDVEKNSVWVWVWVFDDLEIRTSHCAKSAPPPPP